MAVLITERNIHEYLGRVVRISDLRSIYDTWMILIRPKDSHLSEDEGILKFIGKKTNEESDKLYTVDNVIIPIFNDSTDLDGDIFYDE